METRTTDVHENDAGCKHKKELIPKTGPTKRRSKGNYMTTTRQKEEQTRW